MRFLVRLSIALLSYPMQQPIQCVSGIYCNCRVDERENGENGKINSSIELQTTD